MYPRIIPLPNTILLHWNMHRIISEKLYHGSNNIGAFSDSYSKIRYDDEPATADDILLSDSLINELYK